MFDDELKALVSRIEGFSAWTHADKIRFFAWAQHALGKKERFRTGDINHCYILLRYGKPNVSQYLAEMQKGKAVLRDASGMYLEGTLSAEYDARFGEHEITLSVRQMVKDLVNLLPELEEQDIMKEALICLKHDAGRAAILMVWNIAFYHLCQYILRHAPKAFNNQIPIRFPKKWKPSDMPLITKYDDFGDEMSEREVIEVCNSAGIVSGNVYKVYVNKLGTRNSVAHPSTLHVTQVQAEGYIDDLIRNTVLLLKI